MLRKACCCGAELMEVVSILAGKDHQICLDLESGFWQSRRLGVAKVSLFGILLPQNTMRNTNAAAMPESKRKLLQAWSLEDRLIPEALGRLGLLQGLEFD